MKVDGPLVVIAVLIIAGIGGFLYLITMSPNGTPDSATMTLFFSIFAPTVSGLLAAWRANAAVKTALENRTELREHNEDVTQKLADLERKTDGGLTARLNEQTRILLDPKYREETAGKIRPRDEPDDWHARTSAILDDIEAAEKERDARRPDKKP